MKNNLIIALLFIFPILCSAQNRIEVDGNYSFKGAALGAPTAQHSRIDIVNNAMVNSFNFDLFNAGNNYVVKVISVSNGIVRFKYWHFSDTNLQSNINNPTGTTSKFQYEMSESDFLKMTQVYYDRFEFKVGFFTIPYKLRFKTFNFESDISVGANLVCKIRKNRRVENGFSFQPLIGIGLTKINLDESNSIITKPSSSNAFTVNTGAVIQLTDKINFGMFYGFDYLSNKDNSQYDWIHNGNGWFGLGFNVSFSESKNKADEKGQ